MNRRQFFRLASAAVVSAGGIALLPTAILEPIRTYFLPAQIQLARFIPELWSNEIVRAYKRGFAIDMMALKAFNESETSQGFASRYTGVQPYTEPREGSRIRSISSGIYTDRG